MKSRDSGFGIRDSLKSRDSGFGNRDSQKRRVPDLALSAPRQRQLFSFPQALSRSGLRFKRIPNPESQLLGESRIPNHGFST